MHEALGEVLFTGKHQMKNNCNSCKQFKKLNEAYNYFFDTSKFIYWAGNE